MSITSISARRARTLLLSAAVAGAGLAAAFGPAAAAHAATPNGIITAQKCNSVAGSFSYNPGLLTSTARNTTATLKATVAGCNQGGFGSMTAKLTGSASVDSESFSGTATINWPTPLNPSTATVSVYDQNGALDLYGTVTSGPYTGDALLMDYAITGHTGKGTVLRPVKAQTFINTQPLTVSYNGG